MAEVFLNTLGAGRFEAESAGLEPGALNPLVVEVMKETGTDISRNVAKSVFDFLRQGKLFHYVITVCDETSGQKCPVFPGFAKRLHWSFPDPSALKGTHEEKLRETRKIRDAIRAKIETWIKETEEVK